MQFQERDGDVIQAIYDYGGLLTRRHIKDLFWADTTSDRAMQMRLKALHEAGYLDWPARTEWKSKPIPDGESLVWLNWRGVFWLSIQRGLGVDPPNAENKNQLKAFEQRLLEKGMRWLREPLWNQLEHDIAAIDFRMALEKAVKEMPSLSLEKWINEGEFRAQPDNVEYEYLDASGELRTDKKKVIPDGFCVVIAEELWRQGKPAKARLLLELDNATHDTKSFGKEKGAAGLAYIKSDAYKARFGHNSGRWLVVTTGEQRRMENLMHQTHQTIAEGASAFLFTTFDLVKSGNVLSSPIWWKAGKDKPMPLFV